MQRYLMIILSALVVLVGADYALAQDVDAPLLILMDGDIWRWSHPANLNANERGADNGQLERLTNWGFNERPILAPDGSRIAYNSWAEIAVTALADLQERFDPVGGDLPSNIWVWDLATDEALRIAEQPQDAAFLTEDGSDRVLMRSTPTWSPAGDALAWSEYAVPENEFRLVVFDFAANTSRVVARDLPLGFQDILINLPEVIWGAGGISLLTIGFEGDPPQPLQRLQIYDPESGAIIVDVVLAGDDSNDFVNETIWVTAADGQSFVAAHYRGGRWELVDAATGTLARLESTPELAAGANVRGSTRLRFTQTAFEDFSWEIIPAVGPGTPLSFPHTGNPREIALSPLAPGGAAYIGADGVYFWRAGAGARIPGTEQIRTPSRQSGPFPRWGLAWQPAEWRIQVGEAALADLDCGSGLVSRLAAGMPATVITAPPNNLRSEPNSDAQILGVIPVGARFDILSGPTCAEAITWWQVNYDGQSGWTAEGASGVYWLEPLGRG